jgi:hypothetical protein
VLTQLEEENEELKRQLAGLKEKVQSREVILRDGYSYLSCLGSFFCAGIAKNQIASIIRIRLRNILRKRFDRWYRITWEGKYENELRRQKLKVDVGFQHIRSERELVKEIEVNILLSSLLFTHFLQVLSVKLKIKLMCTIAFYRWKVQTKQQMIQYERDRWAEEKRILMKELLLIKRGLISINKKEESIVTASKSRGLDIFSSLQNIGEKIEEISNFKLEIPDVK